MPLALSVYDTVLALHIMAVVAAFGLPLAYPLLLPYVRRAHPRSVPAVHDVQHRLNGRITAPGTAAILVLGAYMASTRDLWAEPWVSVPFAILIVIAGIGGAVVAPATRRLADLGRADVEAAGGSAEVTWGAEYGRVYRRYMAAEITLGVLVLVAIFFMTAKPFG